MHRDLLHHIDPLLFKHLFTLLIKLIMSEWAIWMGSFWSLSTRLLIIIYQSKLNLKDVSEIVLKISDKNQFPFFFVGRIKWQIKILPPQKMRRFFDKLCRTLVCNGTLSLWIGESDCFCHHRSNSRVIRCNWQFWQEILNCVIRLIYQWDMKKCEETNFSMLTSWHWRKQDPGSLFPRSFLNYMTQPSTTQVLALPARSEQYGLCLTPNDWTMCRQTKHAELWPTTSAEIREIRNSWVFYGVLSLMSLVGWTWKRNGRKRRKATERDRWTTHEEYWTLQHSLF